MFVILILSNLQMFMVHQIQFCYFAKYGECCDYEAMTLYRSARVIVAVAVTRKSSRIRGIISAGLHPEINVR